MGKQRYYFDSIEPVQDFTSVKYLVEHVFDKKFDALFYVEPVGDRLYNYSVTIDIWDQDMIQVVESATKTKWTGLAVDREEEVA